MKLIEEQQVHVLVLDAGMGGERVFARQHRGQALVAQLAGPQNRGELPAMGGMTLPDPEQPQQRTTPWIGEPGV